jgi:hypothetical protein
MGEEFPVTFGLHGIGADTESVNRPRARGEGVNRLLLYSILHTTAAFLPSLSPAILVINKQIYAEAHSILYENKFSFVDLNGFITFASRIHSTALQRISDIRLRFHVRHDSEYTNIPALACYVLLAQMTRLNTLHLNVDRTFVLLPRTVA